MQYEITRQDELDAMEYLRRVVSTTPVSTRMLQAHKPISIKSEALGRAVWYLVSNEEFAFTDDRLLYRVI